MSLASIVKDACERLNVPVAELARRTGQSPQNLGKKLRNETLNYEEFTEAMSCLGVQYEYRLIYPGEVPGEMASDRARDMTDVFSGKIAVQRKTIGLLHDIGHGIRNEIGIIEGAADAAIKHKEDRQSVLRSLSQIKAAAARIQVLMQDGEDLKIVDPDADQNDPRS